MLEIFKKLLTSDIRVLELYILLSEGQDFQFEDTAFEIKNDIVRSSNNEMNIELCKLAIKKIYNNVVELMPIGTIVKLINGSDDEFLITQRMVIPFDKKSYYDYELIKIPEGFSSNGVKIYTFNSQLGDVVQSGLLNNSEEEYVKEIKAVIRSKNLFSLQFDMIDEGAYGKQSR